MSSNFVEIYSEESRDESSVVKQNG